jgi:hypothetical protein
MCQETALSNTTYDLLHAMGKDAGFLYETIDTYIKDAQNANKSDLVETWQTIKKDKTYTLAHVKRSARKRNSWIKFIFFCFSNRYEESYRVIRTTE